MQPQQLLQVYFAVVNISLFTFQLISRAVEAAKMEAMELQAQLDAVTTKDNDDKRMRMINQLISWWNHDDYCSAVLY